MLLTAARSTVHRKADPRDIFELDVITTQGCCGSLGSLVTHNNGPKGVRFRLLQRAALLHLKAELSCSDGL